MAVFLENCYVQCTDLAVITGGTSAQMIGLIDGDGFFTAHNCTMEGYNFADGNIIWADVNYWATLATVSITGAAPLYWDGGGILERASTTITLGGSRSYHIRLTQGPTISSSTGNTITWSINTTNEAFLDVRTVGNKPFLSVSASAGNVRCEGRWRTVTVLGNTNNSQRVVNGTSDGLIDITGPCQFNLEQVTSHTIIRGTGVEGTLRAAFSANPALSYVAATHSIIKANVGGTGIGLQAWTFDASSTNNLLIIGGSNSLTSPTLSTDAGLRNRVITELGDFVGGVFISASSRGQQGPPGLDGEDGEPGPPGNPGAPGVAGATGPPGPTSPGSPGLDGDDGFDGQPGPPGATGPTGATGIQGKPVDGVDGEDGMDGFPGPPGPQGIQGTPGATGPAGTGSPGNDGDEGMDGLPGPPGAVGPTGATGIQGRPVDGVDGEDGYDGLPGPQGAQGATGVQGIQGKPVDGLDGDDGWDGFGYPGPAGIQGPPGPAGPRGNDGQDGEDGFDGPPGQAGPLGGALVQFGWNIGSVPVSQATITLADSAITIGSPVVAAVCPISYAQSSGTHMNDEMEMDMPTVTGFCSSSGLIVFNILADPATGPIYGQYLVTYTRTASLLPVDTDFKQVFLLMGG